MKLLIRHGQTSATDTCGVVFNDVALPKPLAGIICKATGFPLTRIFCIRHRTHALRPRVLLVCSWRSRSSNGPRRCGRERACGCSGSTDTKRSTSAGAHSCAGGAFASSGLPNVSHSEPRWSTGSCRETVGLEGYSTISQGWCRASNVAFPPSVVIGVLSVVPNGVAIGRRDPKECWSRCMSICG